MAAPTFVASYESASWLSSATPKTATVTVNAGDVLVLVVASENQTSTLDAPTGGTGLTWTLQRSDITANYCEVYLWTAVAPSSQTFTLSVNNSATLTFYGFNCLRFSGSSGIGTSAIATAPANGTPSLGLTTSSANSALCVINADWNAVDGATRGWLTPAGSSAAIEQSYAYQVSRYTIYVAYHADTGLVGTKTVGLSAPSGQKYTIAAVEVLGSIPAHTPLAWLRF